MAYQQDLRTSTLAIIGALGTLLTLAIVLLMVVLYYRTESRLRYERYTSQPHVELENAVADQLARLVKYERLGTVEEQGETVAVYRIPIERAAELVLAEWKSGVLPGPLPKTDQTVGRQSARGDAAGEASGGEAEGDEVAPASQTSGAPNDAEANENGEEEGDDASP